MKLLPFVFLALMLPGCSVDQPSVNTSPNGGLAAKWDEELRPTLEEVKYAIEGKAGRSFDEFTLIRPKCCGGYFVIATSGNKNEYFIVWPQATASGLEWMANPIEELPMRKTRRKVSENPR